MISKAIRSIQGGVWKRLGVVDPETLESWNDVLEWEKATKSKHPIAFFVFEALPEKIILYTEKVKSIFDKSRRWIRVRFFDRLHLIDTRLDPGFHGPRTRVLHGVFSVLVDAVEIDLARRSAAEGASKQPWWSTGKLRFKSHRNPQAGVARLRKMMSSKSRSSSLISFFGSDDITQELWILYHWWTMIRINRPDPDAASGWSEFVDRIGFNMIVHDDLSEESRKESAELIQLSRKIETDYHKEDDEMLLRAVRVLRCLNR